MRKHIVDIKNMNLHQKVSYCVDKMPYLLDNCSECIDLDLSDIECVVDHKGSLHIYEVLDDGSLDNILPYSKDLAIELNDTKAVLLCVTSKKEVPAQVLSCYSEFIEEFLQQDAIFIFGTSFNKTEIQTDIRITIVFVL